MVTWRFLYAFFGFSCWSCCCMWSVIKYFLSPNMLRWFTLSENIMVCHNSWYILFLADGRYSLCLHISEDRRVSSSRGTYSPDWQIGQCIVVSATFGDWLFGRFTRPGLDRLEGDVMRGQGTKGLLGEERETSAWLKLIQKKKKTNIKLTSWSIEKAARFSAKKSKNSCSGALHWSGAESTWWTS